MGEPSQTPDDAYVPEVGKVAIHDKDGSISKIPIADFNAAQAEGARPATQAEYFGAKHGVGGQVGAGLVGAARGASFGLSDPLYVEGARALSGDTSAENVRNTIRLLKESHHDATLGGEVAGAVAPMLFGAGGAGSAARLEGSFLGRAAGRALEAAPRAVAEGAAIGAGQQLSEDTISNHKLVAENYLTSAVKGGAIGLFLGAGASAGFGAATDHLGTMFGRPAGAAEHAVESIAERGAVKEESAVARGIEHAEEGAATKGPLAARLETEADVRRFQGATNAKVTDIRRLGTDAGEQRARAGELGEMLNREVTAEGKPLVGPLVTQAESAKRVAARLDEVGASLKPLYQKLDTAGVRPSMSAVAKRFAEEIEAPALKMPLGELEAGPAQKYLADLVQKSGESPGFEHLWAIRKHIDGQLKGEYARVLGQTAPKTGAESLRGLRGIIDDELLSAADKASTHLGEAVGDKLRMTNALYRDLATVNKIAQHQAANGAGRNVFSLTDVIAAAHGGVAGVAMTGANMVRRHLGDQLAAHVLDKVSRLQSVQSAAARIDEILNKGTKAFISGKGGPAIRKAEIVTADEVRALRVATSNPSAISSRIADALGDLSKHAPKVAAEFATTAQRTAAWLNQTLPKEAPPVGLSWQEHKPRPLSDSEMLRARHVIETVKDPSIVIDRLREGRLTRAHIDTLKIASPETFLQIQDYIRQHGTEIRPTLTEQQKVTLSLMFESPLSEAMKPENIRAFQATFTQGSQGPGAGGSPGGAGAPKMTGGPVDIGKSRATATDKQEAGL